MEEKKFDFSDLCTNDRRDLLKSVSHIDQFIKDMECGSSFWIGSDGSRHGTDVGYGVEFWEQLRDYIRIQVGNDEDRMTKEFTIHCGGHVIKAQTNMYAISTVRDCLRDHDLEIMTLIRNYVDAVFLAINTGSLTITDINAAITVLLLNSTIIVSHAVNPENGYKYDISVPNLECIFYRTVIESTEVSLDITHVIPTKYHLPNVTIGFDFYNYFVNMTCDRASAYISPIPFTADVIHHITSLYYRRLVKDRADEKIAEDRRAERKAAEER